MLVALLAFPRTSAAAAPTAAAARGDTTVHAAATGVDAAVPVDTTARADTLHSVRAAPGSIPTLPSHTDTVGYALRSRLAEESRRAGVLAPPTFGLRLASVVPPAFAPGQRSDRLFRSYPDRLAESGWIADTDYGFTGLERYLFAPGSPRPPSLSLDGFPVDLGVPALSAFEGWGGEEAGDGQAWWPDAPSAPEAFGAQDFQRQPTGEDALLTKLSLHGGDFGALDAMVQFARHEEDGEWAAAAGVRKNGALAEGTGQFLVSEFRERGLATYGSRRTGWGRWRAALLSSTSDVVTFDSLLNTVDTRQELTRLGLGAALAESVISVAAVLARAGNGGHAEGREALTARVAPRGMPLAGAAVLALEARDALPWKRVHAGAQFSGPLWDAELALESGGPPHLARLRFSGWRPMAGAMSAGIETRMSRGLGSPEAGTAQLSELRIEPTLDLRGARGRARVSVYLERDAGLELEPETPLFSQLLPAPVREARSLGARLLLELPGPWSTRWGVSGYAQHSAEENGLRLPYQSDYEAHAFLALTHKVPFLPMLGHFRLTAHGQGERLFPGGQPPSAAHATLDFEAVLDYETVRFQFGSYNFTNLVYETGLPIQGRPGTTAGSLGRLMRFGVTWDLWD